MVFDVLSQLANRHRGHTEVTQRAASAENMFVSQHPEAQSSKKKEAFTEQRVKDDDGCFG